MEAAHANEQAKKLAALKLPAPSAILEREQAADKNAELRRVNSDIAKLELEEPSRLSEAEKARAGDRATQQLTELISTLQLPDPEAVGKAARRADGTGTPGVLEYVKTSLLLQLLAMLV